MFGPTRGVSGMADSMEPCKMLWANPCYHGNKISARHGDPVAYRLVVEYCYRNCALFVQVEQPHVNILSKVDLIEKYAKLPFNLDFFTEVLDLSYLLQQFSVSAFISFVTFQP